MLIHRIGGKSTDVWEIHYEAKKRQQHHDDVIVLSVGEESDEYTPREIQQAGIESIESGRHHYTSVLGDDRLRHNIAIRHQSVPASRSVPKMSAYSLVLKMPFLPRLYAYSSMALKSLFRNCITRPIPLQ
ncbi:MAG: hypothetical protein CM1200mP18_07740 [Gammaproteobacteria bacterium]|nr:MAG: hypothetical protein CM1200mP18_07740 [Gammaproteobacteria bacterium]